MLKGLIGTAHLDANQIVTVQNKFHSDVLAPTVAAKDDPATPVDDLLYWLDTLEKEGNAFYQYTTQFSSAAGRQARETMFGIQDATGDWITTTAAPGYATQILRGLLDVLAQRTGDDMYQQLGINWGQVAQIGAQIAAGLTGKPVYVGAGGQVISSVPPSQRPGYYPASATAMPNWVLPVGIGVVALILLTNRK
jgi:hypothetical protein